MLSLAQNFAYYMSLQNTEGSWEILNGINKSSQYELLQDRVSNYVHAKVWQQKFP